MPRQTPRREVLDTAVRLRRQRPWSADGCFAVDFSPGQRGAGDPRQVLVKEFKAGNPLAIQVARDVLVAALLTREGRLRKRASRRILVPVPGHNAGAAGWPLHVLCRGIADVLPWVSYRPASLVRVRSVRQSSESINRPSVSEHLESLRWRVDGRPGSVIMVDDVFTFGRVSSACRERLGEAGASEVVLACLAVTCL